MVASVADAHAVLWVTFTVVAAVHVAAFVLDLAPDTRPASGTFALASGIVAVTVSAAVNVVAKVFKLTAVAAPAGKTVTFTGFFIAETVVVALLAAT